MGIFDKLKKRLSAKPKKESKEEKKKEIKKEIKAEGKSSSESKYTTLKPKIETALPKSGIKEKKAKKELDIKSYKVLIKPLVTEKATNLVARNQYTFMVANSTNKLEIKEAIRGLYGLKPLAINIIRQGGKRVRSGKTKGKKKNWKKAIITLKKGDKIEIYEGV